MLKQIACTVLKLGLHIASKLVQNCNSAGATVLNKWERKGESYYEHLLRMGSWSSSKLVSAIDSLKAAFEFAYRINNTIVLMIGCDS
ncbi:MAG: hypothetical protein ACRD8W_07300 [Nitrososphaeraceae archaeon]